VRQIHDRLELGREPRTLLEVHSQAYESEAADMNARGQLGRGMLVFGVLAAFLAIILVLQIYPYLQGQMTFVGTSMSNATGYAVDTGPSDATATMLWGAIGIIIILAFFVEVLLARK
jgi:hypothetical protein